MTAYHDLPWPKQLDHIAALEDDWDSYGSEAPGQAHADALRAVIEAAIGRCGDAGVPYHVCPYQIEWRGAGGSLEVHVPRGEGYGTLLCPDEDDDATWAESENDLAGVIALIEQVTK